MNARSKNNYEDRITSKSSDTHPLADLREIELNITDHCNRSCVFCPHGQGWKPHGRMSVMTALNVSKQLTSAKWEGWIYLAGWGEPLLNPNFIRILDNLPSTCPVKLLTNGDVLYNNERLAEQVFLHQSISLVQVSIYDGDEQLQTYKSAFNKYQKACDLEFRRLEERQPNFTNRAGSVDIGRKPRDGSCYYPFYRLFVDFDGEVILCCNDWGRTKRYGKDLARAWERLDRIYDERRNFSPCNNCSVNGTLIGKDAFDLRSASRNQLHQ